MTKTILDYAEGRLSHEEFKAELYLHPELWEELQSLMPLDNKDPACRFRTLFPNMKLLETNQYRVKQTLLAFDYRGSLAHALVSALVQYHDPSAEIRKPPEESGLSFLEKNNLDFIGGPEADRYVRALLLSHADSTAAEKKRAIREAFHIQPRKRPGWVQDPEWPFRNGKPLRFLSQRHSGELYEYVFEDPETGELVTVTQLA